MLAWDEVRVARIRRCSVDGVESFWRAVDVERVGEELVDVVAEVEVEVGSSRRRRR